MKLKKPIANLHKKEVNVGGIVKKKRKVNKPLKAKKTCKRK